MATTEFKLSNTHLSVGVIKNSAVGGSQDHFIQALLQENISASTLLLQWNSKEEVLEGGAGRLLQPCHMEHLQPFHMEHSTAWLSLLKILLLIIVFAKYVVARGALIDRIGTLVPALVRCPDRISTARKPLIRIIVVYRSVNQAAADGIRLRREAGC